MAQPEVKRFWKEAKAEGGMVLLDGKPVRTPKRNALELPTPALAEVIAAEWNAVGEELDPALFTWSGPVRTPEDQQAELRAEWDATAAPGRAWFADNVTAGPLRVELDLAVLVHEHDEATGAFEATLGSQPVGALARRPRSEDPWDLRWDSVEHRWSTPRWDWALTFFEDEATPEGVDALKHRLGPD